jgi:hypothetical protein
MTTLTRSVFLKCALVVLMLHMCAANLSAARSASGRFSPHCDGASFYLLDVDGLSGDEELRLNLRQNLDWSMYRPEEVWADVYAARCPHVGDCESATRARIWLEKTTPKDKHVTGKYEVDFGAMHLTGTFHAKYRKDKNYICE